MWTRYPRTPHLPWSPGAATDDVRAGDLTGLTGREVVVTEKLDGENTTLYPDGLHARSLDSGHHPSRAWVKGLHERIARAIPPGWRVCGENLYARHSIGYDALASWFYVFSVWAGEHCLDWDATVRFTRRLGVPVPPVLWRGTFDERALRTLRLDLDRQEGYVVRTVAGFTRADFTARVAKWVRPAHVQTDTHWMNAPVVPNGRGPTAPLWDVRSGAPPDPPALFASLGLDPADPAPEPVVADAAGRLDLLGRTGDLRLAGVLAALLHRQSRPALAAVLREPLGLPLARRVADLVGRHTTVHRPFPDEQRRAGLVRLAGAADLGVLHAVAGATLTARSDPDAAEARDQVAWSMLYAEDAGLLDPAPLWPLRTGLRTALADTDPDVADRCWAQAREAYAAGRITTPAEATALTWRWRTGGFPRLVLMVGPAGSGKSSFAAGIPGATAVISLDDLRAAHGRRADQRHNPQVLRDGLARLDTALAAGGTVVWDATSLTRQQRRLVHTVAARRDALVTHAVLVVDEEELVRRNTRRAHAVPAGVLAGQWRRFTPPYPDEAHRTWYVGPDGTVADVAGSIDDPFEDPYRADLAVEA
ncbi:Predicted kinase [Micromonospora pallida]|uniref:Predicted kinase n=1 Tax=Micromonospora pallida TaxID=145854 RepID=A0A1C6S5Q4_9ACTN|nr:RNA ligase family protein [Micromonospora pallida]SCL24708.1 Predicted kinase [Micromonospora pallida]